MRNSSVELFRIIATLLVLIVHFNGWFVGGMPNKLVTFDVFHVSQSLIESLSCTCVNCFLVITGWYGLRFKWKHIWTIWSILVWIYVPFYIVSSVYNDNFSIVQFILRFIAITQESYYVQCYLMLLFLSPILNSFIQRFGKKILPYTLAFWSIEIIFDWVIHNRCLGFANGYMLTHFVLMYVLGQTAFLYKEKINKYINTTRAISVYFYGAIAITCMYIVFSAESSFAYTNPINIIMSFAIFLIFEKRSFYSNVINWVSRSTLAVYIFHITPPIISILRKVDVLLLNEYSYVSYLGLMIVIILLVFVIAILFDKIRILIFTKPGEILCNWLSKQTQKYSLYNE